MAALDTVPSRIRSEAKSGLRAFDIGRDLRPVAELIAEAFTDELDPRGQAALREMRLLSHLSGLIKILSRGTGEFDDVFNGYVWVEENKIVGNITVQRSDKFGNRWQIANVAVAPAYRGRGIARALMARALEHIDEAGGRWAVLQVYDRNTVARTLYDRMGFDTICGQMEMRLDYLPPVVAPENESTGDGLNSHAPHSHAPHANDPNSAPMPRTALAPFSPNDWLPLYELANKQYSAHFQWWRPLRRIDFQTPFEQRLGEWFLRIIGKSRVYRRAIHNARQFDAALILTVQRWRGAHKLEMWTRPEAYGQHEEEMVQWSLATLREYPRLPVFTNLSTDHAEAIAACRRAGFQPVQTLLTMRREVE